MRMIHRYNNEAWILPKYYEINHNLKKRGPSLVTRHFGTYDKGLYSDAKLPRSRIPNLEPIYAS